MRDPVVYLAERVADDPFFLGSALSEYACGEKVDDAGLATALGCRPEALPLLWLCRMPAEEPAAFRRDIDRIAGRFGADPEALAQVVSHGQALRSLRAGGGTGPGSLLAARDADPRGSVGGQTESDDVGPKGE